MTDPSTMQFATAEGKGCRNCLFEHERASVCHKASATAVRAGLPDCEYPAPNGKGVIYVAVLVDDRQTDLFQP